MKEELVNTRQKNGIVIQYKKTSLGQYWLISTVQGLDESKG